MSRLAAVAVAVVIAACAPERESAPAPRVDDTHARDATAPVPPAKPSSSGNEDSADARGQGVLTPAGLAGIAIGKPPPTAGAAALVEDKVQISEDCRTLRNPRVPGVYAMTDGKVVTRVTVMRDSAVTTARGIGPGATETAVRSAYPELTETPHEYADAPAKNLEWRPAGGTGGLRFEIGPDGRVSLVHAGLSPWLEYSEGCA